MSTINQIAELAWRIKFPRPSDEIKNMKEEFVESAKIIYAGVIWEIYQRSQTDSEKNIWDGMLDVKIFDVDFTNGIPVVVLDIPIVSLPRDIGIYRVLPLAPGCEAMTKTTIAVQDIFSNDPDPNGKYYRIKNDIYFPKGFPSKAVKQVQIAYVSTGKINGDEEVVSSVGEIIMRRLVELYSADRKVDDTNNQNANA